jgi:hypothetical protein
MQRWGIKNRQESKKKTWGNRHPETPWRLIFLLHTEHIIENIEVYLSQT